MNDLRLQRRPLGATGLSVSRLGLAALSVRMPGTPGSALEPEDVERAFHEQGINTFLVHPMMKTLCEGVRRLVRAGHRDELVLVSEASFPFGRLIRRALEKNLKALGTDRLDAWLLGWIQKEWWVRDSVWSEMQKERERGDVRAIGFSSHDRPLAAKLGRELPADVLMIRYNAAHRGAESEVFAALAELGDRRPGVIAYTATRWGMLLEPLPDRGFPQGMSGGDCYRFVLEHPVVDAVWCAPRTAAELAEDVTAVQSGPLDPKRIEEIRRYGDAVHAHAKHGKKWMFREASRA